MRTFLTPSGWYRLEYPDNWSYEIDEVCTSFFRDDGVGALQISAYETESNESAADNLREYLESESIEVAIESSVSAEGVERASSAFVRDDSLNKIWTLAGHLRFVFVTYIRDLSDLADEEEAEVEQIQRSLMVLP